MNESPGRRARMFIVGAVLVAGAVVVTEGGIAAGADPIPPLPSPSLPVPTVAPASPLPTASLAVPTASLAVPTASPLPSPTPLPTVSLLPSATPLPTASLPLPTQSLLPSATPLPTLSVLPSTTPLPTASLPLSTPTPAPPRPTASLPVLIASPLPAASSPAAVTETVTQPQRASSQDPGPKVISVNRLLVAPLPGPAENVPFSSATTGGTYAVVSIDAPSRPARLVWLVPGLVLGLPGALMMIIVGAQVVGAATFLGLTRRTLGSLGIAQRIDGTVRERVSR